MQRGCAEDRDAAQHGRDDQTSGTHGWGVYGCTAPVDPPARLVGSAPDPVLEVRQIMRDALGAVQTVFVLGGNSEIARVTVERLIREGHTRRVILGVRDEAGAADTLAALAAAGTVEVDTVVFDAADPAAHVATIDEVFAADGDIDVVLVAFGVLGDQEAFEADPVAAAQAASVNYAGVVSAGLAAARGLRAQGHGHLVFLSSVAGERARRSNFVYGSSKAGMDAFAQGLSDSLVGSGVDVLIVRPGFVHTKMTEGLEAASFSTTPDVVADAIVEGIARRRRIVWVPGALRWAFTGMRHLPTPLWRRVSADA